MSDIATLLSRGDRLFEKRGSLASFWQECAEQFYPERADFTSKRSLGSNFADHLTTSYPVLVRRDLGNSFSPLLRPTSLQWFHMKLEREEDEDQGAKQWLEYATGVQKRAMYDRRSQFVRASKESDHDIACFGQSVKTLELNRNADGLLYRCWHLRDVAWAESIEGKIDTVHRKWKPCAYELLGFGFNLHPKVRDMISGLNKKPYEEVDVRHIVMPADQWDGNYIGKRSKVPFVEMYIDVKNKHLMAVNGLSYFKYIIPRWQTVSGSQYSFSPATVCALPDARLLQAMTLTLLEAGEKAVNPPMVAVQEAIRSDISIYAGGITYVDSAYDEKTGEVLRPLTQDKSGMPLGLEMQQATMATLQEAFFINKLTLPAQGEDMTAYEVSQRVQEYIRQAAPLFEPLEDEDNAAVCDTTFELLMRNGAFGPWEDIPQSIRNKDVLFRFESPLHDAIERQKGQKFMEAKALLADTLALDPTADSNIDIRTAFRDCLNAIGVPAKWIRSEEEAAEIADERKQQQEATELLATMGAGAEVAKGIGEAGQALQGQDMAA